MAVKFGLYLLFLLAIIIFICLLESGVFSKDKKDHTYEQWDKYLSQIEYAKERRMEEYLKQKYADTDTKAYRQQKPKGMNKNRYSQAHKSNRANRDLEQFLDLALIDTYALSAQMEIFNTIAKAKSKNRGR